MQKSSLYALAAAAATAIAVPSTLFFFSASANSQIRVTPTLQVVGTSATSNASTAWFMDSSGNRVIACQSASTSPSAAPTVQCSTAQLP